MSQVRVPVDSWTRGLVDATEEIVQIREAFFLASICTSTANDLPSHSLFQIIPPSTLLSSHPCSNRCKPGR